MKITINSVIAREPWESDPSNIGHYCNATDESGRSRQIYISKKGNYNDGDTVDVEMKGQNRSWDGISYEKCSRLSNFGGGQRGGGQQQRSSGPQTGGSGSAGVQQKAAGYTVRRVELPTEKFMAVSAELVVMSLVALVAATKSKTKIRVKNDDGTAIETTLGEAFAALQIPIDPLALWETAQKQAYGASVGLGLVCISAKDAEAKQKDAEAARAAAIAVAAKAKKDAEDAAAAAAALGGGDAPPGLEPPPPSDDEIPF